LEDGVARIYKLREENHPETGKRWTYQQIATDLGVSMSTVYNVLTEKTHKGEGKGK
jgi:transposase